MLNSVLASTNGIAAERRLLFRRDIDLRVSETNVVILDR